MLDPATPAHLDPSALGTKEYWDTLYEKELSNHADNPSDEGTVWFDDSDAENKIVSFLDEHAESDFGLDRDTARVLDLGCGNGSLLFALRDDGWRGALLGVDYSERSVELARRVGVSRGLAVGDQEEEEREVDFKVWDVLSGPLSDVLASTTTTTTTETTGGEGSDEASETAAGWDLVLDKGTFDAVSLSGERDAQGRRICEGYGERVLQLLRKRGIFLVTSCNWTEAELREWFESKTQAPESGARLRLASRIEYPSFSFGGVKGQTISTLCFEKVGGR
ncbi:S-adenosyl-L-methionine-dependent methyltransferase [Parathielavia appendiculata]|uniref:Protein-lysine N-methyltransferase EFM4 n=1 Tax=Parathielavia appendiculata TaxID=2587402 RepID=A0AAN6TZ63_9PEZI|nr:S-adenosyl-L-methionine-dependent methyltransferase [Parathielavia appendiculata]